MSFITEDFLLETDEAKRLFHDHAAHLPIIDYHSHLSPKELATDHNFENISEAWLRYDHYKWRAMRTMGIQEQYITGDAPDVEKFQKWAEIAPYTIRNPLYHWTQLELKRYFEIDSLLSKNNADTIYKTTTEQLQSSSHSALGLLAMMNVDVVCTTDDPTDNLEHHRKLRAMGTKVQMHPTFRPDKVYAIDNPEEYRNYLEKLGNSSGKSINTYADLLDALEDRISFFHDNGCRIADHGLEFLSFFESSPHDVEALFSTILEGRIPSPDEVRYFQYHTLSHLCHMYHQKGWVQQFHLGALRNTNKQMYHKLGPDAGFDSIGDFPQAQGLAKFLGSLDGSNQLAKTILYNLNPAWNEVFATMAGNFNSEGVKGKIQFGSGWWYNDQLNGMERQLNTLSNMGLLSCFVGMLTDSRSLLSFPRHEYFRRLLCNMLGTEIKKGLLPYDLDHIGSIVKDICYFNAKNYFDL
ncbi:MAG: glucuronate isomerase [Allomuricauda sp.]